MQAEWLEVDVGDSRHRARFLVEDAQQAGDIGLLCRPVYRAGYLPAIGLALQLELQGIAVQFNALDIVRLEWADAWLRLLTAGGVEIERGKRQAGNHHHQRAIDEPAV